MASDWRKARPEPGLRVQGVAHEDVSSLLDHRSIQTTELHCTPWAGVGARGTVARQQLGYRPNGPGDAPDVGPGGVLDPTPRHRGDPILAFRKSCADRS